jgi:signal transduction histidine kinase
MRLYAAFAGAVLAILVVAATTLAALKESESSNQWLTHSYEVREATERVLDLSIECEAALRGYLMSGHEQALTRFRTNERALGPALDQAEKLTADNTAQLQRIRDTRRMIDSMLRGMNAEIAQRNVAGTPFVIEVRAKVTEMLADEDALLAARRAKWLRLRRLVFAVALGGGLLLLVLTGVAALAVRGDLRRREQLAREKASLYQFQERLIGIVGHDLRNPLSAVLVSTQYLLKRKDELRDWQLPAVERIARSASRIDALGNMLVDFTHARLGGGVPVRRETSDARPAVERALDELRSTNQKRSIVLKVETANTTGLWDVERIAQIVSNLVSNALRYGAADGQVTVTLDDAPDDALRISVHNPGNPIPAELLPHLFDPYKRGASAPASYSSGLGLGLYIVREIAVAHGGEVTVESASSVGTTFRAKLPRNGPRVSLE